MSEAVARLVALAAAGGAHGVVSDSADGREHRFPAIMSDAVREAGFNDPALAYVRSAAGDDPVEGFVDEATDTYLFFPLDPAHDLLGDVVADYHAPTRRHPVLPPIFGMVGAGLVLRSLLHPDGYVILRSFTGLVLIVVAFLLFRRRGPSAAESAALAGAG